MHQLAGVEDDFGSGLILFRSGVGIELVDFAAGNGGGVERAVGTDADYLHAYVVRLKERERLAIFLRA